MALEKQTYPYVPAKHWWALREKFIQSIPSRVTPAYLVTVIGGQERSAKANVLRGLQSVGLVDENGATTERAKLWRDDASYSKVCTQMRDELYPVELLDAVPGPVIDKEAAMRWFMTTMGCGKPAATKMAAMYALLVEAAPTAGNEAKGHKPQKTPPKSEGLPTPLGESHQLEPVNHHQAPIRSLNMPEMRLNLEIRIDAGVTTEQIDKIFESMAKYLYRLNDEGQ